MHWKKLPGQAFYYDIEIVLVYLSSLMNNIEKKYLVNGFLFHLFTFETISTSFKSVE